MRYTVRMPAVHLEVERKYAADDAFELPPLSELVRSGDDGSAVVDPAAPVAEGEPLQQHLEATYFDTADLRLAAGGLTLRRRSGGDDAGWHLKVPVNGAARSEVRLPLGRATRTVPEPLRAMVRARTRGAELRPVAEITTERTVRRLVDATGQVLIEVADDRVTARRLLPTEGSGDAASAAVSWREIEVELVDGGADLLTVVDSRMRAGGLGDAGPSKLARVLDGGAVPPAAPADSRPTRKARAGDVVLAHIREQVAQITTQDLPGRLDAPDSIHKMRVATRRLRSALTTFKPLFADDVVRPLRDELRWLAAELGAARDAEVLRDRVSRSVEAEGAPTSGPAAAAARSELDAAYTAARDRVLAELDGDRYHRLLTELDRLVTDPPVTERADGRATKVLPKLVAKSYARVRGFVEEAATLPDGPEREELLHDARKAAKASRYAGESVAPVFGEDADAFAAAMEAVQEALGEHQDSVLAQERLRDLATRTSSTETAFLYGRLHALEEARSARSQGHFDEAWKAAGRKSLHRWLR